LVIYRTRGVASYGDIGVTNISSYYSGSTKPSKDYKAYFYPIGLIS